MRRQGIYGRLWEEVVVKAREMGVGRIEGITDPKNHAAQAAMDKQGRVCTALTYGFDVPALGGGSC
jgi:RimJ/RimL family protein N-acetyltransferase